MLQEKPRHFCVNEGVSSEKQRHRGSFDVILVLGSPVEFLPGIRPIKCSLQASPGYQPLFSLRRARPLIAIE